MPRDGWGPRPLLRAVAAVAFASVAAAFAAQHLLGMQPCPWCVLQRLIFLLLAVASLFASAASGRMRPLMQAMALGLAAAGLAAALWQWRVAERSSSCDLTLADRIVSGLRLDRAWPAMFEVRASCAEAAVNLLGLPFALWSALGFAALGAGVVAAWRRR